jgi:hypothetical protein
MIVSVVPELAGVLSIQSGGTHSSVEFASLDLTRVGSLLLVGSVLLGANELSIALAEPQGDSLGLGQPGNPC